MRCDGKSPTCFSLIARLSPSNTAIRNVMNVYWNTGYHVPDDGTIQIKVDFEGRANVRTGII
jgi:hypothetical protein